MSIGSLVRKFDDLLNPIVVKELRQAVTSRMVVTVLLLTLVVQTGYLAIYLLGQGMDEVATGRSYSDGKQVFQVVNGIMAIGCLVLLPAYAWGRLSTERSETNVDLLFITTLKPRAIVSGKLFANLLLLLMLFSACAPFMAFSYLLRGVDVPSILLVMVADLLLILVGVQFALLLGSIPSPRVGKVLLGLMGVNMLWMLGAGVIGFATLLVEGERFFGFLRIPMWVSLLSVAVSILVGVGFYYFWSVALLSSPASNRAKPVRIYTFLAWLIAGGMALGWAWYLEAFPPLILWVGFTTYVVTFQLLISICEREEWGPRISRKIPRSLPGRMLAFLYTSGSAGGILFGVLLLAITFGIGHALPVIFDKWRFDREYLPFLNSYLWLGFAYTYCYAMTALTLRRTLMKRSNFKRGQTWVLALLVAVGFGILPWILASVTGADDYRYNSGTRWWLVGIPFAVMEQASRDTYRVDEGLVTLGYAFTGIWMAVLTLLNLPNFVNQFARFRRQESKAPELREAEAIPIAEMIDEPLFEEVADSEAIQTKPKDE